MKQIFAILLIPIMVACSALNPDFFKAVDDIATDTAIKIEVDKAACGKDTNVNANVYIHNKEMQK